VPIEAIRPARVVACRTLRADVDPSVDAAFSTTLGVIENDLGIPVSVVDTVFDDPSLPFDWFMIGSAEFAQAFAWCEDRWDDFEPGLQMLLHVGAGVTTGDYLEKQRKRYQVAAVVEDLLGHDAVLLTPTLNVTSWAPDGPMPQEAGAVKDDPAIAVNTVEFNFTGHPAVSVPMGISPEGVPIGLQVVAPRFGDRYALGLAAALEQAQPWPTTAPGHDPFDAAFT
jgi:aspartyl-tRNA(Asn)/glutamyl-tRNA(Gln) amidotransferase subunit A